MKYLILISFFTLSSCNFFSKNEAITTEQFNETVPGTWVAHYYSDTSHTSTEHLSYVSNIIDTFFISTSLEITQKRIVTDSMDVYIYKEVCNYDEKLRNVNFFSEGSKNPTSYKLLSLNQDEIVMEFYGIDEEAPTEKKRVEVRYKRVKADK